MEQSVQEGMCNPHAAAMQTRIENSPVHLYKHGVGGCAI